MNPLIDRLLQPEILGTLIPIVAILVAGIVIVVKMVINHRERMARLERGMEPQTDHHAYSPR